MSSRGQPHAPRPGSAGFTLVELMVVAVIIGLIGGVAVMSWISLLPNQQFNSAVRNLSEVLYGTRADAIARNREFRIYYDLDNETYRVRTPFKPGGGFSTTEEDEDHLWAHETDLKENGIDILQVEVDQQVFTDGRVEVDFLPLGAASHHTIQLRQTLFERDFTLEVLPLTGEIRMHDGLYERDTVDEGDFK